MVEQLENALEVRDVRKIYSSPAGDVTALKQVSVAIQHNEFFTLLGPSGCGKTTLLRLFAGFEQVTEGEIYLYGEEIEHLAPHQRPINTVFQHYALFPHMTVRENIAYGLKRLRQPDDEIEKKVTEMLAMVHMEEFGDRKPTQMSGGQMQRVALARALAPQPKVLLLDEPLSALDLKLRQAMRDELQRLQRETGITFVFVTHDQDEALSMSDRIAVMSNGEIQQIGTPEDIYKRPGNRFVADFIGDTNIVDVTIESRSDSETQYKTAGGVVFTVNQFTEYDTGTRVALNIRPENVVITADNSNRLVGTLVNKTFLGRTSIYSLELGDGTVLKTRYANQEGDEQQQFDMGDKIGIDFTANSVSMLTS
jgi:spermidine/putrescine transport system ATP-binding protein